MSMQLPVEVLEAIIDQASDNTVSLHHLSLACTTLIPRCRYYLFSDFVIRTVQKLEASRDFLDSCPWLAPLVRKVTLFVTIPRDNSKPNVRILDVTPIHLLARLSNLHMWTMETGDRELADISPSLSLHRSVLQCYQKHGESIRSLELSDITFYSRSDFKGLVSAFTGLDSLTCYDISFQSKEQHPGGTRPGTNVQLPQVSTLKICTSIDRWAVEYLLACSESKLKHLTLQLRDRLQKQPFGNSYEYIEDRFSRVVHSATTILERIDRVSLTDVHVEFKADLLAKLGARLSGVSAPLEACKQLEAALLTFPNVPLLVGDPVHNQRAGRAKLWSPIIRCAFPRLDDRGLLALDFTHMKHDAPDPLGHEDIVSGIFISHNSAQAATFSSEGTIIVWDTGSGAVLWEWPNHQSTQVDALALSLGGRQLVSACGHTLTVWDIDIDAIQKVALLEGHTDVINACAWSPDDTLIAAAFLNGTVYVWDGHTFEQRGLLPVPENPSSWDAQCLQFSPDSRHLAWISGGKDCHVWQPLTMGDQPKTLRPHPDRSDVITTAFSFDHESQHIATAHGNQDDDPDTCVVRVWDAATGSALAILAGHSKTVSNVLFSPDGRSLLSTSGERPVSVRVWDRRTWSVEQMWVFGEADVLAMQPCFSLDRKYIATSLVQGLVRLWRTSNGECVATFVDDRLSMVIRTAFSPNGQFLVSGDTDGVVRIRCLSEFE